MSRPDISAAASDAAVFDITSLVVAVPRETPPRTYHGDAGLEGKTVIIGGAEIVVGGWAAYEAERRRAKWTANPHSVSAQPLSRYRGRTYITGQDALESLIGSRVGGGAPGPLVRAADRLATAIENFETAVSAPGGDGTTVWARLGLPLGAPVSVSAITAEDVRNTTPETDVNELHRSAEDAGILASTFARADELPSLRVARPPSVLPPLPSREVSIRATAGQDNANETTNQNITRLEAATVPRASSIESYRGDVAAVFDAAAGILERAVATKI